ncbi:MAG: TetR/AcrR family transcriptional regulator [Deltaproteobacteria bacterium]|nr:TetR/AcrR family transcriptional regulator [Deltaproteobacteria bacterium]
MAYHHGNLRRTLLDAALALFGERGTFDFTLRELAREAGVTHNAPYRHFAGKGELLASLRAEGFAALADASRAALEGASDDPRARVRALGEAYVRFAIARPLHFRLMLHNPLGEAAASSPQPRRRANAADEQQGEAFGILRDTIEGARKQGVVRDDLSARELALGAWALVHGLSSLAVAGQVPADEPRLKRYVRLLDKLFFEGALHR